MLINKVSVSKLKNMRGGMCFERSIIKIRDLLDAMKFGETRKKENEI